MAEYGGDFRPIFKLTFIGVAMEDRRTPFDYKCFADCENLEAIASDIPANVVFLCREELQVKCKSVCAQCPHFEP